MADKGIKIDKLYRSETNKIFLGVLGGLGEYFNVDPTFLRLVFVLVFVFTGFLPGLLVYLLAAVVMPVKSSQK